MAVAAQLNDFQAAVLAWSEGDGWRDLPWRRTRDPWAVLVSEVMLQQTQVARVVPCWHAFLDRFPNPGACAAAPLAEVITAWAGLGYNRRAVNLHRAAVAVVEGHDGRVPSMLAALRALPGIGPYTARAVLAFAFEQPVGVVDTNIARVLARAVAGRRLAAREAQDLADGLVPAAPGAASVAASVAASAAASGAASAAAPADDLGAMPAAARSAALSTATSDDLGAMPTNDLGAAGAPPGAPGLAWRWNQVLLDLGARHCTSGRPACTTCPVRDRGCVWARAGRPEPDPATGSAKVSARQSAFEGSDRQGRGRLVRALQAGPITAERWPALAGWPDDRGRAQRVVASLVADGLAVRDGAELRLP